MSRIAKLILVFALILFGLAFHLKNNQLIELNYYISTTIPLPISIILVLVLCLGALLGVSASLPIIIKLKRQKRKLKSQIKNSEKEINNLRVMPVKDSH